MLLDTLPSTLRMLIALAPSEPHMDASLHPGNCATSLPFVSRTLPPILCRAQILIVDNCDRSIAHVKHQLLVNRPDADDSIKCAMHGLDGLVVAEEFHPELVIVHLGLPRRSGACTAKLLRGRPWANQVVIVSHSDNECAEDELQNQFDFHFYGGIDVPLLMQMYRNLAMRRASVKRYLNAAETAIKPPRQSERADRSTQV